MSFRPSFRSASAFPFAASSAPDPEFVVIPGGSPPVASPFQVATPEQLLALTAVPAAMHSAAQTKHGGKGKRKGGQNLARDGQIIGSLFDCFGRRPFPTNGLSLEQGIQLEMSTTVSSFIATSNVVGATQGNSRVFVLTDFAGSAPAVQFFDQYRFDQIEVWINFISPNGMNQFPELVSAVDLDDANVPVSFGQVSDKQGALIAPGPSGRYHKWRPHMATAVFSGAFTSFSNVPSGWIDCASPGVQHFGLKTWAVSAGSVVAASLEIRAVISFRAPAIQ